MARIVKRPPTYLFLLSILLLRSKPKPAMAIEGQGLVQCGKAKGKEQHN